jgi:hypothetical protein
MLCEIRLRNPVLRMKDCRGPGMQCARGMMQATFAYGVGSANRQVLDTVPIQDHLSGKLER